jgi:hypothetical protein
MSVEPTTTAETSMTKYDVYRTLIHEASFRDVQILRGVPVSSANDVMKYILPKYSYWKFFLNWSRLQNVVVAETSLGQDSLALSENFDAVVALSVGPAESEHMRKLFEFHGKANITVLDATESVAGALPKQILNLVLHNIDEFFRLSAYPEWALRIVGMLLDRAMGDGCILYSNDCRRPGDIVLPELSESQDFRPAVANLMRKVERARQGVALAFFPSLQNIASIVPYEAPKGSVFRTSRLEVEARSVYRSLRNSSLARSRGKVFLPPGGAKTFFDIVAERCREVDRTGRSVKILKIAEGNPVNAMIVVGGGGSGDFVARVPLNEYALERTRNAFKTLTGLHERKIDLVSTVPRVFGPYHERGETLFLENRFIGRVVGGRETFEDVLYALCIDWVTKFHTATLHTRKFAEEDFHRLLRTPLQKVESAMSSPDRRDAESILGHLRPRLVGRDYPFVCMHGDYKIENVIFDSRLTRIAGVIDWDLSEREGIGVLDLLNLIFFHRHISEKIPYEHVMWNIMSRRDYLTAEGGRIDRYLREFGLSDRDLRQFLALFWIHHVCCRYNPYVWSVPSWVEANFSRIAGMLANHQWWV